MKMNYLQIKCGGNMLMNSAIYINKNNGNIWYLQMQLFGQVPCTLEAGPNKKNKIKTQDLFH